MSKTTTILVFRRFRN